MATQFEKVQCLALPAAVLFSVLNCNTSCEAGDDWDATVEDGRELLAAETNIDFDFRI